jgi:hypothetical protein
VFIQKGHDPSVTTTKPGRKPSGLGCFRISELHDVAVRVAGEHGVREAEAVIRQ